MGVSGILAFFVYLGFQTLGVYSTGLIGNTYRTNASWNGLLLTVGYQARGEGRSRLECGASCGDTTGCESFFYSPSERACYLFDFVLGETDCIQTDSGSRYYYIDGGIADPIRSELYCGATCGVDDDTSYRTVNLIDGSPFTYRIYRTEVNQSTALANCASEGAELVKVLTLAKMNFLRYIIVNCSDYALKSFWIDGSNAAATDFNDITQWVTSDNQVLPSSAPEFWVSGHPNSPANDHCVPIWQALGHFWTDRPCSDTFPYICEMNSVATSTPPVL